MKIAKNAYETLIIQAFITSERINKNFLVKYNTNEKEEIYTLVSEKYFSIASEIANDIYKELNIKFSEDEILYLSLHLSGKVVSDLQGSHGNKFVISSEIDKLVVKMLDVIYEAVRIDFRNNIELRMSLNQHIVPLDIRMRYDIPLINPIIKQIKEEYAFVYTIAISACSVLSEYYNKEVPEDEIGYIAILFDLAMEKRTKNPKNIIL
ncbi:MAG: PRD domain-containing protein [Erysipelotrichaceae bacterium]|nr:PRD domain-containing protein [Erysipelotrichaceae bacterium]